MELDTLLRQLVKTVVKEVIAQCGQGSAPQLYDIDQAAARLRVPKRWLYEEVAAGAIPFRKVGNIFDSPMRTCYRSLRSRQVDNRMPRFK